MNIAEWEDQMFSDAWNEEIDNQKRLNEECHRFLTTFLFVAIKTSVN